MAEENIKHIVRVLNTDIKGEKEVFLSLQKITGVGNMFSNMILSIAGIPKSKKAGTLSDSEVKKIEEVISTPKKFNVPDWMLNRRKDYESGENIHLITTNLKFTKENDLKRMQKTKSYRGLRLSIGLTVRGQRTKSNFRRSKGKGLGVKKKR